MAEDFSHRINFTPELWEAAASLLREEFQVSNEQMREMAETEAMYTLKLIIKLEIARRANDQFLLQQAESEYAEHTKQSRQRMAAHALGPTRIAALDEFMAEAGARSKAVENYMMRPLDKA